MKRKGSLEASTLFQSEDVLLWNQSLAMYEQAVKLKADMHPDTTTKDLVQIDQWFRLELPSLIENQGFITSDQLCRIMDWKLKRGQFRPLMKLVKSNTAQQVESITREAVSVLDDVPTKDPITLLSQLSGIGPATASAILISVPKSQGKFPFMADEAVEATGMKLEYTAKAYRTFTDALRSKAEHLGDWTAELVGRALWTHAMISALGSAEQRSQLKAAVQEIETDTMSPKSKDSTDSIEKVKRKRQKT